MSPAAVRERTSSAVDALLPVIRAVEILSPTAVRVAGERMERAPATPADAATAESGAVLLPLLTEALYGRAYARRLGWPDTPRAATDDDLLPLLTAANPGRERWEAGWQVKQALSTGRVVAERYGATRFLWPGEFLASDAPGTPPRAGVRITVWRPRESATLQPGFYFVFGEAAWEDDVPLLRVYWNATPAGAPALTAALAGTLNRWGLPFRYKCLSRSGLYPRTDSAVLYVARRSWPLVRELVAQVHRTVAGGLDADVPLFARRLARGMAAAEDPGTGESFGMHRCRLVADGLWAAWRAGRTGTRERLAAVRDAFARAGVSVDRPWLNAGSTARYEMEGADA
ncbi:MAG TPA: T3SS effector HopA1 family protein [Longimicrobium sp.]|nr:T3SS effector HopA1 family protein [Longimicrobium sp.]